MTTKRIIVFAIIAALFVIIGVQRVQMAHSAVSSQPSSPQTPFVFVVREYGEVTLAREYICEHLTLTVLGQHRIRHNGELTVINVDYRDQPNTRILADVGPLIPAATADLRDQPNC